MPQVLITYELSRPRTEYGALWDWFAGNSGVQVLDSGWVVVSPLSTVHLLEELCPLVQPGDRLLVVELSRTFAWMNPMADPGEARSA